MLFTVESVEKLNEQIELFHLIFISQHIGTEVLNSNDRYLLRKHGYSIAKLKPRTDSLRYSYYLGKLESSLIGRDQLKKINFKQFKQFVKENKEFLSLTRADNVALKTLKQATYNDIKRLANDIKSDFTNDLIEVSKTQRLKVERILKRQIKGKEIPHELILGQIKDRLVKNTKKWLNRFELISGYRMHEAYQTGISNNLMSKHGLNVRVWYSVHPDACEHCKRIYLFSNGTPKIFYLKNIIANGSNIGKNLKTEGVPSVSPIHPRCRCKMNVYVYGSKYNAKLGRYMKVAA